MKELGDDRFWAVIAGNIQKLFELLKIVQVIDEKRGHFFVKRTSLGAELVIAGSGGIEFEKAFGEVFGKEFRSLRNDVSSEFHIILKLPFENGLMFVHVFVLEADLIEAGQVLA